MEQPVLKQIKIYSNKCILDYNEILQILHPVFGRVQRIEHVKIHNYIENIVRSYNNIDFIMHFRFSREKAYELINQFEISEIFISQGMYYCL